MLRSLSRACLSAVVAVSLLLVPARPAAAVAAISGTVTDAATGAPIADVCVTLGPPISCATHTDASGTYGIDVPLIPGITWDLWFLKLDAQGKDIYQRVYVPPFAVPAPVVKNVQMQRAAGAAPPAPVCAAQNPATATMSVYLPNVTKTLGGPSGFVTPFIVQNTGAATTSLEVSFYKFGDGTCVARRAVASLAPGTSFADIPNNDGDLPGDSQFSVVVRSFGSSIVSVVNEQAGAGDRSEALSYVGASQGALKVSLPNITRRFFGYHTPFIIQNLGGATTTATASFVSFDGSAPQASIARTIAAGRSQFVEPNVEAALMDGKQYAVTVTADQPIAVVVNTHNDDAAVAHPVAYSTNGITQGAATVYGAYAARNAMGIGRLTTIVVQNLGATPATPTLAFTPLGGGTQQTFTAPAAIAAGAAWAFDPRFTLGTTTPCALASSSCIGDGEYSFVASAPGGQIAAVVNVISPETAMGYGATAQPAAKYFLPNVTRTLGGSAGWTTPILLQAVTATGVTLRWFRFSDGALVTTQTVTAVPGSGLRIDPRTVSALADDTQYAVVAEGNGGTVTAIVMELASGGDNAMIYEGFPAP